MDCRKLKMAEFTFPVLPIQKFAGRNSQVRRPTVSMCAFDSLSLSVSILADFVGSERK